MRARVSIVMPTLNAAACLSQSLPALAEGLQAGLIRELVISDGGSDDGTVQIAEEAGAVLVRGPGGRGGQLRRGAEAAAGDWFLFLHADTVLPEGWSRMVQHRMQHGTPGYFLLGFDAPGVAPKLVAAWANLRARLFHLPYGDQGLLVSRDDYEAAGGYPDIPLMEDVAIARALGSRLRAMPGHVVTSAERYRRDGWLRRGAANLWRLVRYLGGADPERLARRY